MESLHEDFYKKLRKTVKEWAKTKKGMESKWIEYIMAAPDLFHLLCCLTLDNNVPVKYKAKLGVVILYFISPIDLIPDFIPVIGYLDDIAVAAYVLNSMFNTLKPELFEKHWAGDGNVFVLIKSIIKATDEMIGQGLWDKIKRYVDDKKL